MTIDQNTIIQGVYSLAMLKCYFPRKILHHRGMSTDFGRLHFLRDIYYYGSNCLRINGMCCWLDGALLAIDSEQYFDSYCNRDTL